MDIELKIKQEIRRFEEMKQYFSVDFETGVIVRTKIYSGKGGAKIGDIMKSKIGKGYIDCFFNREHTLAHRFIFYCYHGTLPEIIDHKNGIKDDNRILNLRGATHKQNGQNRITSQSNNKTRYLGVYFFTKSKKYVASIVINGKKKYLGLFECPIEAHEAYLTEKRINHEFNTI